MRLLAVTILAYALLTRGGLLVSLQASTVSLSLAPTKIAEGMTVEDTIQRLDRFQLLPRLLARKQHTRDLHAAAIHDEFHRTLESVSEPLSFTNVILLGLALWALFGRRRTLPVAHMIFSVHFVSFVLLSSLLLRPSVWLMKYNRAVGFVRLFIVVIWQFAYLATAMRRFCFPATKRWLGRVLSGAAALVIYLLNSVFITAVQTVGAAYALWTV